MFKDCNMVMHSNCSINFEPSRYVISNSKFFLNSRNVLKVGEDFSCLEMDCRLQENGVSLHIGRDCMFSTEIRIYSTDGHAIYQLEEPSKAINRGGKVVIGDHVWIGRRVVLLKDACISDNSVVGFGSIVTKQFLEPNIVIAGTPARIIKRGINWDRETPEQYTTLRLQGKA